MSYIIFLALAISPLAFASPSEAVLPLDFSTSSQNGGLPSIVVRVQGKNIPVVLDTGAVGTGLALSHYALRGTQINFTGEQSCYTSVNGETCDQRMVESKVEIGDFTLNNVPGTVISRLWGTQNKKFRQNQASKDGVIGLNLLSKYNLLLDYAHKQAILVKPGYLPMGYKIQYWKQIPFQMDNGIVTEANINGTPVKLVWDTGSMPSKLKRLPQFLNTRSHLCTRSINYAISDCRYTVANKFEIDDRQLPKTWFLLDHLPQNMPFDGLVGSNFYANNTVYFDFQNDVIYVS